MSKKPTYEELEEQVLELGKIKLRLQETEKALEDSETRLNAFLDYSPIGLGLWDRELRYVYINDVLCKINGQSFEEHLGHSIEEVLPKTAQIIRPLFEHILSSCEPVLNIELSGEVPSSPDENKHYLVSYFPVSIINGTPQFIGGVIIDITEPKQMEEVLRKQNYYLTKAQEIGQIGTWELDLFKNRLLWTDENCRIFGLPEGSVVDYETFISKVHPDDREYVDREWKAAVEGKPYDIEHRLLLDGEVRWVREKADVKFDDHGKAGSAIGITQDITDRKQSIEELNRIFELSPDLIGFGNVTKGYYTRVNPAYKIFGRPLDEFLTRPYIDFIHPDDHNVTANIVTTMQSGQSISGFVNRYRCKDGSYRTIEWRATEAQPDGSVCVAGRDITDRMKRKLEKEKLEKQLLQSQKLESIGNLAGGIAHDFNNILSSIIGFTELALEETPEGTVAEDSLQEVFLAGNRAKDLVQQILAFARQSDEKRAPLQPCKVVNEVLKFIRSTIPTNIEIQQNLDSESWIMGNATQVHQVLMNLCTNAAHAMEDAGGVLTVSMIDVHFNHEDSPAGMESGDYVEIKVSDTGSGIASEIIDLIFEPYFTTKQVGEGTGMGLAMVQGVIESYGGKISVARQMKKGTTLAIYLPLTKRRSGQKAYVPEQLPTGTEHILLVDDEQPIAKMGSQILERLGYSVTTRTSSVEALELFQAKPNDFDLIITDMTMPNMTGDQLSIELMKIRPDIPIVLCTGYSKGISDEIASEIGIKAFVYKPIVKADLAKTVRKVLGEAKG